MNNEFIPYDEALALKELGFDEPCFGWFRSTLIPSNFTEYFLETEFGMNESPSDWVNSNFLDKACSAPLYQQAFKWFREKYDLHGKVGIYHFIENTYCYSIVSKNAPHYIHKESQFETYEEAELECLRKLIQIVKEQK